MDNQRKIMGFMLLILGTLILVSCSRETSQNPVSPAWQPTAEVQNSTQNTSTIVIRELDRKNQTIVGASVMDDQRVTAVFDGSTTLQDSYQTPITLEQLAPGDLVDLIYQADGQIQAIMKTTNPDCWEVTRITDLPVDRTKDTITVLKKQYHYTNALIVVSNEEPIELLEINNCDKVTVRGYKGKAYSIVVEEGHGYVKLKNYDTYIGGTVSVGSQVILPVMEDMLLTIREGSYRLTIEKDGHSADKRILVKRDQVTKVNLKDVQIPPVKECRLVLNISPDDAFVQIDQNLIDPLKEQKLAFGTHHIQVTCKGYQEYEADLELDTTYLKYTITLEEEDSKESSFAEESTGSTEENTGQSDAESSTEAADSSANTSSEGSNGGAADSPNQAPQQTTSEQTKNTNKLVYILEPKNAKVYVDGLYQGVSPLSFTKKAGDHVITFNKEGYVTKSYKITVVDDGEDSNMSFPAMLAK